MTNQKNDVKEPEQQAVQPALRSAIPLFLIFIGIGLVCAYFMAPELQHVIKKHIGNISLLWTRILFGILCLIISVVLAVLVHGIYTTYRFGWLSLLVGGLIPVLGVIISAAIVALIACVLGILAIGLIVLVAGLGGGSNSERTVYFIDKDGHLW